MATANPLPDTSSASVRSNNRLLVLLAELPQEQLECVLAHLASCFPPEELLIATTDKIAAENHPALQIISIPPTNASWSLTAADFANTFQLAQKNNANAILMLGPECGSLCETGLCKLANAVTAGPNDLVISSYELPSHAGLVNSAILYPLSRALFASPVRFPLAIDLGLSLRMAERLATAAKRFTSVSQNSAPLWPVSEAAVAGFTIQEVDVGPRDMPQPAEPDLNTILPLVTGSLFADIDAKAAFWQRARQLPAPRNPLPRVPTPSSDGTADMSSMLQGFRLAYTNLLEIWSLVLPPNSLLGLKRLSLIDGSAFRMPDSLWARIVYDFLLSFRLRTINRGHLLGALIPLYLAWVASHINVTASGTSPEDHIEAVAAAFEAEKPYIVSRWRWPDRFNP
jgi:hypothetical protein